MCPAGTSDVPVLRFKFIASGEAFNINNLRIKQTAGSTYSRSVDGVKIVYKNQSGQNLSASNSLNGDVIDFNIGSQPIYVPANGVAEVNIYATIKTISGTTGAYTNDKIQLEFIGYENFNATGVATGNEISFLPAVVIGNEFIIHKSYPVFTKIELSSQHAVSGSNVIFKFKVTAVGPSGTRVMLKQVPLTINLQGSAGGVKAKLNYFRVQEEGVNLVAADCGTDAFRVEGWKYMPDLTGQNSLVCQLADQEVVILFNQARTIAAGASKTYTVYANLNQAQNVQINTYLSEDGNYFPRATTLIEDRVFNYKVYGLTGNGVTLANAKYIWSDASGTLGNGINDDVNNCTNTVMTGSSDWFGGLYIDNVGSSYNSTLSSATFNQDPWLKVEKLPSVSTALPVPGVNIVAMPFSITAHGAPMEIKKWWVEIHSEVGGDLSANDPRVVVNGSSLIANIRIISEDNSFSTESKDITSFFEIASNNYGVFATYNDAVSLGAWQTKNFKIVFDTKRGLKGKYYFVLGCNGGSGERFCFSPTAVQNLANNQYVTDIVPLSPLFSTTLIVSNEEFGISVNGCGSPDTAYVLKNETYYGQNAVQSYGDSMIVVRSSTVFGEFKQHCSKLVVDAGRTQDSSCVLDLKIDSTYGQWTAKFVWAANYPSFFADWCYLYYLVGNLNIPLGQVVSYTVYAEAGNKLGITNTNYLNRYFVGIDGIRGDVNRDGVVDNKDVLLLLNYSGHGWFLNWEGKYTKTGLNYGLGSVLFNEPDLVSAALINIWLHNHNDPLVQGLGIGELFSSNANLVVSKPFSLSMIGGSLNIATTGNVVNVSGYVNGSFWQKTEFVQNGSISIALPEGLKNLRVEAVKTPATITSIDDLKGSDNKKSFELKQNYPNPFNPSTTINYSVATAGRVSLKIFDILGKEVATLVNEEKAAGNYELSFDASRLSSGTYVYQLRSGGYVANKKMLLIK